MLFSQRSGFQAVRSVVQVESVDQVLCNGIWNVLYTHFFKYMDTVSTDQRAMTLSRLFWCDYYKRPITSLPRHPKDLYTEIMERALANSPWYEIYDLCEVVIMLEGGNPGICNDLNDVLQKEMSGYRVVNQMIVPLVNDVEIDAVDSAMTLEGPFAPVARHLATALSFLSDRSNPNHRNSIKESISAVEAMSQILGGTPSELGKALKAVESRGIVINGAVKSAFKSLYGFTSDEAGIRHALTEDSLGVDADDAKFMLVACSAFINLLRARGNV